MARERQAIATSENLASYPRFNTSQRIEHLVFLISFTILGFTGLIQKFANSPFPQTLIAMLGGIDSTRIIHRSSSVVMMIVSVYHILAVFYRVYVLRVKWTMMPLIDDAKHILQDIAFYLGLRLHRAYYGRYNYAEKMEYLAVVWGTIIMAITGFMMWNPISTARLLPGQAIPAAKAAHGGEALLAVLAIILWHFYHVHVKRFNKSMFTGNLSREEMKHEHPAELDEIESGKAYQRPPFKEIRRRQQVFFPIALLTTVISGFGLFKFVTFEDTATAFAPQGETVQVFVPQTPTPQPTPTATPTIQPGAQARADSWGGYFEGLFRNRCSTCHGVTKVGGLTLATYQDALTGGNSGPGIVPGEPDASKVVEIQSIGNHPGQLTIDELNQVIDWILAGAPEQ